MPITWPQLLDRLLSELGPARSVWWLGLTAPSVQRAGVRPVPWHPRAAGAAPAVPDVAVVAAGAVSPRGDVTLAPRGDAPAAEVARAADVLRRTERVIALLAPAGFPEPGRDPSLPPQLVGTCTEPVLAHAVVHRVLSPWAVLDVGPQGLVIRELAPDVCARKLQQCVEVPLRIAADVAEMGGAVVEKASEEPAGPGAPPARSPSSAPPSPGTPPERS